MSLSVMDLKPGDRVVLNCPKARGGTPKREAVFEGVFQSLEDAKVRDGMTAITVGLPTLEFLRSGGMWARFLMQRVHGAGTILEYPGGGEIKDLPPHNAGITDVVAAFVVEPDGSMREEMGRRVFIERRVMEGQG